MRNFVCWLAIGCSSFCLAEVNGRAGQKGDFAFLNVPSIRVSMAKGKNYCPVMNAKDKDGKSFNFLMMTKVWYHGRTGNAERFYQDQDEHLWTSSGLSVKSDGVVARTGTVDWDVTRTVTAESDSLDAVRLEYVLTAKESRYYDPIAFPLLYFSKEVASVSFDDGKLANFTTAAKPSSSDLIRSRAMLLHFPERGKTVAVLSDVNFPLELGHPLGVAFHYGVSSWCRTISLSQLWCDEWPFYAAGERIGVRLWFKVLDGSEPSERQFAAVRALAEGVGAAPAKYSPTELDCDYVEPSALAALLPSVDGISIWTETPMHRVYPKMRLPKVAATSVELESCRNERESFQLVLNPNKERTLLGVAFSDFVSDSGARISAANCRADRLGYETIADMKAVFCGETRFADRMIPLGASCAESIAAGENTILHLTVYAPAVAEAGVYRGKVTLSFDNGSVEVPVDLKVWNVELPAKSAYTAWMLMWCSPFSQREKLLRRFVQCGLTPTLYTGDGIKRVSAYFDGEKLTMPDGFALAEKSVKEFGLSRFQIPWAFMGAWNWTPKKKVFLGLDLDIDSEEFNTKFRNYLTEVHSQLAARGVEKNGVFYMWDEMTFGHYPAMRKTTEMVRKYAPGSKILTVSAPDPEVVANNDIVVAAHPAHWWSAEAKERVAAANAAGKEIWMYANSVTFGTASRALIPRLTPWLAHALGMCGYLHWSADYNWKGNDFAKNGKEWIVYPSQGEQIYSVRTEYIRDGIEDFNLMKLVEKLPAAKRNEIEALIATAVSDHSVIRLDPVLIRDIRRKIAQSVEGTR